jgi:hypothetical protein
MRETHLRNLQNSGRMSLRSVVRRPAALKPRSGNICVSPHSPQEPLETFYHRPLMLQESQCMSQECNVYINARHSLWASCES